MKTNKRASASRQSPGSSRLQTVWQFARGPGRPFLAVLLAVVLLYGFWHAAWHWGGIGQKITESDDYFITEDDLEITPPPKWIHTDIRGSAFRLACPDNKSRSILDDRIVERVRSVFALEPWVARVISVHKHHPPRIGVELEYRRPVCMVEVPGGLYPVDVQGTLLPLDFSPIEANAYPRLAGIDTSPMGAVGTRWGDPRVVGGAEIAGVLIDVWGKLQLQLIRPLPRSDAPSADAGAYCVYTMGGTRIVWGLPPGVTSPSEPPATEKAARLQQYALTHGSLDGQRNPHEIDLRDPRVIRVTPQGNAAGANP